MASQSSDIITHDGRPLGLFKHRIVFVNPRALSPTTPTGLRKWLELIEDSLDRRIDETAYPNPLFQKVIAAIETTHMTPRENYWFKEEAIWEDTKDAEFVRGEKKGHDDGLKEGLCKAIVDICELLGVALDEARSAHLDGLDVEALERLRKRIKQTRSWPQES